MNAPDRNHIRAFHAPASTGSFSAAARTLGLTQPLLSRQVAALEAEAFRLVSDNSVVIWEMARRGMGGAAMLAVVATCTPGSVRLMPDLLSFAVPAWLVSSRALHGSRRIRLVHDILAREPAQIDQPTAVI